jgi:hypothetical protein
MKRRRKDQEADVDPVTLAEAARLLILDPARLHFSECGATLRLTIDGDRSWRSVNVVSARPLSEPARFLCVRAEDDEVGVIEELASLTPESRTRVEAHLARRYLVPKILRILSAVERFGTVEWDVETDRGRRTFSTQGLRETVRRNPPARLILIDVDENRYDVPDFEALDELSQQLLAEQI